MKTFSIILGSALVFCQCAFCQLVLDANKKLAFQGFMVSPKIITPIYRTPLLSFLINNKPFSTESTSFENQADTSIATIENKLKFKFFWQGNHAVLLFSNISKDTVRLANVVPLGESKNHIICHCEEGDSPTKQSQA